MKPVTITIPEELDARAAEEAERRGISKSELFRQGLAVVLPQHEAEPVEDPWHALAGFGSASVTAAPGEIDDVIYRG